MDTEGFQGKPAANLRPKMSVIQLSPSPQVRGSEWQVLRRRLKAWVPGELLMQVLASKGFRTIVLVPKGSSRMLPGSRRGRKERFQLSPASLFCVLFVLSVFPEGWTY